MANPPHFIKFNEKLQQTKGIVIKTGRKV